MHQLVNVICSVSLRNVYLTVIIIIIIYLLERTTKHTNKQEHQSKFALTCVLIKDYSTIIFFHESATSHGG